MHSDQHFSSNLRDDHAMEEDVKIIISPSRWARYCWVIVAMHFAYMTWVGPSVPRFGLFAGLVTISFMWNKAVRRRALWLTADEVVVANSDGTHIVPRAGAGVKLIDEHLKGYGYTDVPEWDNSQQPTKRLYIVPADRTQSRIQVDAAQGLTRPQLVAVYEELELALASSGAS